jgi:glutamine amidotransferase-like uncharacterized protein
MCPTVTHLASMNGGSWYTNSNNYKHVCIGAAGVDDATQTKPRTSTVTAEP